VPEKDLPLAKVSLDRNIFWQRALGWCQCAHNAPCWFDMHKKPKASKPRASTAPQAGGHAVMRSRPAWRQTTQRGGQQYQRPTSHGHPHHPKFCASFCASKMIFSRFALKSG